MLLKKLQTLSKPKQKPNFQKEILINNQTYTIQVKYAKKKHSSASYSNQTITFRFPEKLSNKQLTNTFNELLKKIQTKLQKTPTTTHPISPTITQILKEKQFQFNNTKYNLTLTTTKGIKFINETQTHIRINQNLKKDQIEKKIIKLLITKYTPILTQHLEKLNQVTYNFKIKNFHIADLNSKWGHCTHDNKIMLNLKLLNTDLDILNYVIFHELCHIKHKNHSQNFWNEVSKFCPNHKQLRKKLKNNPPPTFLKITN